MASNQPRARSGPDSSTPQAQDAPSAEAAPLTPAGRLRRLLEAGELVVAPGVYDGLSAHLVRQMGFLAGYLTAAVTALRDIGGLHSVPLPVSRMEDFFRLVGLDEWFAVGDRWPVGENA